MRARSHCQTPRPDRQRCRRPGPPPCWPCTGPVRPAWPSPAGVTGSVDLCPSA